jgi:hypothetical protein
MDVRQKYSTLIKVISVYVSVIPLVQNFEAASIAMYERVGASRYLECKPPECLITRFKFYTLTAGRQEDVLEMVSIIRLTALAK